MRTGQFTGWTGGMMAAAAVAIFSPAMAHDTPLEAANKKVVLGFYAALDEADATGTIKQKIKAIAEKYLSPGYLQHSEAFANLPGPGTARDRLVRMFQGMPARKPSPPPRTVSVMAEGDKVMLLTSRQMTDPGTGKPRESYIFNMFLVRNGKLAEHWDIAPSPPGPGS